MEKIYQNDADNALINILEKRIELQDDIRREFMKIVGFLKSDLENFCLKNYSYESMQQNIYTNMKDENSIPVEKTIVQAGRHKTENSFHGTNQRCSLFTSCPVAIFGASDSKSVTMYAKSQVYENNQTDKQFEELRKNVYESPCHLDQWKIRQKASRLKRRGMFLCPVKVFEDEVPGRKYMFPLSQVYPGFGLDVSFEESRLNQKTNCRCYRYL